MEFVGRTVRKEFKGFGVFSGVVKSYDSSSGLFQIGYDDGDFEDVDFSQLTALFDGNQLPTDHSLSPSRVGGMFNKRRKLPVLSNSGNENCFSDSLSKKMEFSSSDNVSNCCHNLNSNDGMDLNSSETKGKGLGVKNEQCLDLNMDGYVDETKNQDVDLGGYVIKGENSGPGVVNNQTDNTSIAQLSPAFDSLEKTPTGGRKGRKRKSVADSPKTSGSESVLRRSARRRAKVSADEHDGDAMKVDESYDEGACALPSGSSPVISVVSEEQPTSSGCKEAEEPSTVPLKLELPPSTGYLNLDDLPVLDLFSVYAFLRSFSTILFLEKV